MHKIFNCRSGGSARKLLVTWGSSVGVRKFLAGYSKMVEKNEKQNSKFHILEYGNRVPSISRLKMNTYLYLLVLSSYIVRILC